MRRKQSRLRLAAFAALNAALALLVQLAPTLHALTPHEEHSSSCKHSSQTIHFEAAPRGERPPCIVCAQLMGRQALVMSHDVRFDGEVSSPSVVPLLRLISTDPVATLPDSRGPPPTL